MIAGLTDWMQWMAVAYAAGEPYGGLGRGGLITVIVVSVIGIVTFWWIFRETGKRE